MSETMAPRIGPEFTIVHAAAHRETLLAALGTCPGDLTLALADVMEVDSSAVQLLLALRRTLQERGHQLRLTSISRPVHDVLALYRLQWLAD